MCSATTTTTTTTTTSNDNNKNNGSIGYILKFSVVGIIAPGLHFISEQIVPAYKLHAPK